MNTADLDPLAPLRDYLDPAHMMDIAHRFVCEARVTLFEIDRAIRARDEGALRRSATKLRSQALFLGLRPLAHHCGLIELHPATGHRETELAIIRGEIDQLQKALENEANCAAE